jgi:SSS family solute:Na+ symporter
MFGGALKLLPLFLFVIPGMIAYCLNVEGIIELKKADEALPTLVRQLLPVGLKGVVVAGLLAALTSSLASCFNSCSTLVTIDVYKKLKPTASERSLVQVGRVSTFVLIGIGLAWIPFMKLVAGQLYSYLQSVQAYISPPVAAVFLFGVMYKRLTSKGAMAALITGFCLGIGRLMLDVFKASLPTAGLSHDIIAGIMGINFLHYGVFSFLICCAVMLIVSRFSTPKTDEELANLTFQTGEFGKSTVMQGNAKLMITLSILIMAVVALIWIYFSPLMQK